MPYDLVLYSNRKRGSLSLNLPSSFPNLETLQSFKHKSALHTQNQNGPIILAWWEVYSSNLPINIPVFYFFGYFECHGNWLKAASVSRAPRLQSPPLPRSWCSRGVLLAFAGRVQSSPRWHSFPSASEGNLGNFCNHQKQGCCDLGHGKRWGYWYSTDFWKKIICQICYNHLWGVCKTSSFIFNMNTSPFESKLSGSLVRIVLTRSGSTEWALAHPKIRFRHGERFKRYASWQVAYHPWTCGNSIFGQLWNMRSVWESTPSIRKGLSSDKNWLKVILLWASPNVRYVFQPVTWHQAHPWHFP